MLKRLAFAVVLTLIPLEAIQAHEIWLERSGDSVKVFVGDKTGEVDHGETIEKLIASSHLFGRDQDKVVSVKAAEDHLLGTVDTQGDVRYYNDGVWAPWQTKDGGYKAAVFQAKAGRQEIKPVFDLEMVPDNPGSDTFILIYKGNPLPDVGITVINPDNWEKTIKTDEHGHLAVPVSAKGLYVLVARHQIKEATQIAGQAVSILQHIASVSFVAE